jgi:hypothetical protein
MFGVVLSASQNGGKDRSHSSIITAAVGWALTLLVVALGTRVSLVALHALDNGRMVGASLWFMVACLAEDLKLVLGFAFLVAGVEAIGRVRLGVARRGRQGVAALNALLGFWMVLNIPVARFFSTPLTYSLLHATGSAIGDSIAGYMSVINLGLPVLVWVGGQAFAYWVRPRLWFSPQWVWAMASMSVLILALAPSATRRVDTLGLHRNAVMVVIESTLLQGVLGDGLGRARLSSAACAPTDASATTAMALHDWVGLARGRSVVWVILESTGARALATYGAFRAAMPHLDRLAQQSLIFENAYTAYPESIKGLFSVLCSREPAARTEASDYAVGQVPCRSIADEMARAGFRTGLFHSGWFVYLGMRAVVDGRGFSELHDAGTIASPFRTSFGVDDRATADRVLSFVDSLPPDQPFFAVFMPIAGHHPYHAPGDAVRPFPEIEDKDAYTNDLHVADQAFGRLREGLRLRHRDEKTIYIVFGDHGEAFREHEGNIAHALFLYEENVRVPLFIAAPGVFPTARRIPGVSSLIDIAPTTLALAGIRVPEQYEGRSLLGAPSRVARFATEQAVRRVGLRDGNWKFILDEDSSRVQLFDLASDPEERINVAHAHPDLVGRYRACVGR